MRRRILSKRTNIKGFLVTHETTEVGDILLYDVSADTMRYFRIDQYGVDTIQDGWVPVSIILKSFAQNVYGDYAVSSVSLTDIGLGTKAEAIKLCNDYSVTGTNAGDWRFPNEYEIWFDEWYDDRFINAFNKISELKEASVPEGNYWCEIGVFNQTQGIVSTDANYTANVRAIFKYGQYAKNYGEIMISGGSVSDIPAYGGTQQISGYTYSQTWGYGESTTNGGITTSGGDITIIPVSAESLGTTPTERTLVGVSTVIVEMNGKSASHSIDVYQQANERTYGEVTVVDHGYASDIPAKGGTVIASGGIGKQTITFTSKEEVDGIVTCGDYNSVSATSLGVTPKIRTNVGTSSAILTGEGGKTAIASVYVYQSKNDVKVYGNVNIVNNGSAQDIPASGGTITASGGTGTQDIEYDSEEHRAGTVICSAYSAVSANTLGTTPKERKIIGNSVATLTGEGGKTANVSVTVYQQENKIESVGDWTGVINLNSTAALSAANDSRTITYGKINKSKTYTSNDSEIEYYNGVVYLTCSGSNYVTCSANHTNSSSTSTATLQKNSYLTNVVSAETITLYLRTGSTTGTPVKTISINTVANNKTTITYGNPSVNLSYSNRNAATGTVSPSYSYSQSRIQNYTSTSTSEMSALTTGGTLSFSETTAHGNASVNTNTGVVTWDANQTTSNRSVGVTLTVTMNGKSGSKAATSTQTADAISSTSYGNVTAGTITNGYISAAGGSAKATAGNGSQGYTNTWVSGRTTTGTNSVAPSPSSYETSASSKGITASSTTTVGTKAVTWTGSGGKSATGTMYIYQNENKITNSDYQSYNGNYTASCSIGSGITAAGGSATVSKSAAHTHYYRQLYSSNSVAPSSTTYYSSSVSDNCTISIVSNGNNRFSLSGTTLSHSTMDKNLTTDTCTIRCTNSSSTGATKDASVSVTNSRSVSGTSGGVVTYGAVTAGKVTEGIIPASGGSATSTAGNGSQYWSKTAVSTSYKYTSGATTSEVTQNATTGNDAVAPSKSSLTATANSLGTTLSSLTVIKSETITYTGKSGYSKSSMLVVYQEKNEITSTIASGGTTTYSDITPGTITPGYIPASGGSAKTTIANGSQTKTTTDKIRTTTYTSGAKATETITPGSSTNISVTPSISELSSSAPSRGSTIGDQISVKSANVTWTANGKTVSRTVHVYQSENKIVSKQITPSNDSFIQTAVDYIMQRNYITNVTLRTSLSVIVQFSSTDTLNVIANITNRNIQSSKPGKTTITKNDSTRFTIQITSQNTSTNCESVFLSEIIDFAYYINNTQYTDKYTLDTKENFITLLPSAALAITITNQSNVAFTVTASTTTQLPSGTTQQITLRSSQQIRITPNGTLSGSHVISITSTTGLYTELPLTGSFSTYAQSLCMGADGPLTITIKKIA